jgi:activator of HSP90 ATPase
MRTKNINQTITFKTEPAKLYDALTDSTKYREFTHDRADVSKEVGAHYSAYSDYITGVNMELVPEKRIVQTWRASDWPEGYFSKVVFDFKKVKKGTKVSFTHMGVPYEFYEDIKEGWDDFYWRPLKQMLEKHN